MKPASPQGAARNFIYVSVIPANFQGHEAEIYNYNKPEADLLLNMKVGESKSLRADATEGFTYTRKPDTTIGGQTAMTYENTQPDEFPAGTKEIRYYIKTDAYTYMIGGYFDTTGANLPGAITEEFFNEIVGNFQLIK
jgi:outer membrane protease